MVALFVASTALTFNISIDDDVQDVTIATTAVTIVIMTYNVFLFIFEGQETTKKI
jgi:hypothetical protein